MCGTNLNDGTKILPYVGLLVECLSAEGYVECTLGKWHVLKDVCSHVDGCWCGVHDGHLAQRRTSLEGLFANQVHILRNIDACEFLTVLEGIVVDVLHALGYDDTLKVDAVLQEGAWDCLHVCEVLQLVEAHNGLVTVEVVEPAEVSNVRSLLIAHLTVAVRVEIQDGFLTNVLIAELNELQLLAQRTLGCQQFFCRTLQIVEHRLLLIALDVTSLGCL